MQLVQDGRQAAAEGQQLSAGAVEADAHGALQGDAAAVAQQRADERGGPSVRKKAEQQQKLPQKLPHSRESVTGATVPSGGQKTSQQHQPALARGCDCEIKVSACLENG